MVLMTISINHLLYVKYFTSLPYETRILQNVQTHMGGKDFVLFRYSSS
jgi:hypothetical protein